VIRHAVSLYFRSTLCLREVEELLGQRGIEVNYETIRCWTRKIGQVFASNPRRARPAPTACWHLDEMVVKVGGKRVWLWRAVDDEGEVLDVLLKAPEQGCRAEAPAQIAEEHRPPSRDDRHRWARLLSRREARPH